MALAEQSRSLPLLRSIRSVAGHSKPMLERNLEGGRSANPAALASAAARLKALLETCSEPRVLARACSGLDGDAMPIGDACLPAHRSGPWLCAHYRCWNWRLDQVRGRLSAGCFGAGMVAVSHRVGFETFWSPSGD